MSIKNSYYISTAIAYASGKPHIGNTYEIVLADAIARFKREEGFDVYFQTGTDEHGQKIEEKAAQAGISPREYVDKTAAGIKKIWDLMNTSYDYFIRTTEPGHEEQVQKIFKKLYDQGDIYKGCYEGMYCTPCESFWTESQLVDGRCPDCGREVKPAKEEAYFFKMSKYADLLIKHIEDHPEFIQPESRKNEMMNNFLKPGLQDLCVSRTSFTWGIPVDFDSKHVIYVWLDALTNYITGIGYDCSGESSEKFKKYWPADLHLIGKDIIRFHTIYWPIFLMALGLPLPRQVFGHPWLLQSDGKMSKSRGNVLYADTLVDFFGVDAVRYFVLHEMPFENDGVISIELMAERYNSELANVLGNLVSRTAAMSNKYFDGIVSDPKCRLTSEDEKLDNSLIQTVNATINSVKENMDRLRVADAITQLWGIFKRCNKYIDETAPWILAKDSTKTDRLKTVLYNLTESIVTGASLLYSFMPETSEIILKIFDVPKRSIQELESSSYSFGQYPSGTKISEKPQILFARLDPKEVVEKLSPSSEDTAKNSPQKPAEDKSGRKTVKSNTEEKQPEKKAEITYDDFDRLQFQIGEIIECSEVEKSRKLLCSQVRIGNQVKQILSGIKAWYKPEDMVGKKVMVLTNLKTAMLAGMKSEGMILCAEDDEGNLSLMIPEKDIESGSTIC